VKYAYLYISYYIDSNSASGIEVSWLLTVSLINGTFAQISKQAQPTIKTHQLKEGQSLN